MRNDAGEWRRMRFADSSEVSQYGSQVEKQDGDLVSRLDSSIRLISKLYHDGIDFSYDALCDIFPWIDRGNEEGFIRTAQIKLKKLLQVRERRSYSSKKKPNTENSLVLTSHAFDAIALKDIVEKSGIKPEDVGIIVFDRHVDDGPVSGGFDPRLRACALTNMVQNGFRHIALIGSEGNDSFLDIDVFPGKWDIAKKCQKAVQSLKERGAKHIVLSVDLDVLDLWNEEISGTMYSPFLTLIALASLNVAGIKELVARDNRNADKIITALLQILGREGNFSEKLSFLFGESFASSYNYSHAQMTTAGFSGVTSKELINAIKGIRKTVEANGMQYGISGGYGHHFIGTITEFYQEVPDIDGNTVNVIEKIDDAMSGNSSWW